ncbi:MAG: DUF2096 domain-containing protein [Candidatus Aminicenantes bacterium]|nr:DUF2096 domain-containing protein [Candidatus Aminicenantes bacterium]NIM80686.1 DUF2096 domain-containing protein [Candidatus Aminicenantes bacterium]NIN20063.1 DUF2096 domain-containing protein [Candidatus Aminicenantes bacterium]NIN43850.1 DUF2096 domain-containing protein [Candidatus Aminicenantes bacterium]NIN86661.1 DUF2096 domain-containing protein [Candidatus Aminicenantes bacterium]
MHDEKEEEKVTLELLKKYGVKWAVLAAMVINLKKKGANIPFDTSNEIEVSHVKISSGCFSPCDVNCDLSKIEGNLVPIGVNYGEEYMNQWFDLLGKAMSGELEPSQISEIPLLKPIESRCGFLDCTC